MKKTSKKFKISTKSITISGDVKQVATNLARLAPKKKNSALIFGGEPTVIVKGKGKGGTKQQWVLRLIAKLQNSKRNDIIYSNGTVGIDGNTKYAGAISANIAKISVKSYLKKNNSNSYFKKHGGLINTGYTHTNLLDVGVILI
jgi:hydroxypyruvate reductase